MGDLKKEIQAFLARINRAHGAKEPEVGTPEWEAYVWTKEMEEALRNLIAGRQVTLPGPTHLVIHHEGDRLVFEEATDQPTVFKDMLRFVQLVNAVGVGRVRQCALEGCERWFVARKAQTYCSLAHGNRGSYLAWKARQERRRNGTAPSPRTR